MYNCPTDLQPGAIAPLKCIYSLSKPEFWLRNYLQENLDRVSFCHVPPLPAPLYFFWPKRNVSLQPCITYRALNTVTTCNCYPLLLIKKLFEWFHSAQIFTMTDLYGSQNVFRIQDADDWKTAFHTHYRHFEYRVMPFVLCNSPTICQHFVNYIFQDVLDQLVIIYLDIF